VSVQKALKLLNATFSIFLEKIKMAQSQTGLSRRTFLQGIGASAVGLGLSTWFTIQPALAQGNSNVTAFTRFKIGEFEVTAIQDAVFPLDSAIFGVNADPAELNNLLTANNLPFGTINATVTVLLVNTGSDLVLLDTGNGGSLVATLELLGIGVDAITGVVISHFHGDHIGGLTKAGELVFPNATVYFPQMEWDFMENAPANSPASNIILGARTALQPAIDAGKVVYYAPNGEITPGIEAVAAHGHTPGHSALLIRSGEDTLLNIVDTALNSVVSLARTDWFAAFDSAPEEAAETRRALLMQAAVEGTKVFGYHFAFPGIGYVVAEDMGFEFRSVTP
jgi:glyoxylase-like metal-dependent hydrolase (beta-lactamase superfamily II)